MLDWIVIATLFAAIYGAMWLGMTAVDWIIEWLAGHRD